MNSQNPSSGAPRKELQGPRPSPLKICKDSRKIRKPAAAVPAVPSMPIINRSQPMIIYMQSPKIIHAEVQDFMTLVQRLTGSSSSSSDTPNSDQSENLTADRESTIQQASAATTSYQPAESVENMGMSNNDSTSPDFVNPNSGWTTMNDRDKEIGSKASEPEANEHGQSAVTSASTIATTPALSPFSPNFLFPSPRLNFSPNFFQDLPLMTPNSDPIFYSPRDFYRISEPLFSPRQRPPLNTLPMLQSSSPTTLDLHNTHPDH